MEGKSPMINEIINAFLEAKGGASRAVTSRHGSRYDTNGQIEFVVNKSVEQQNSIGADLNRKKFSFIERGAETSYKNSEFFHANQKSSMNIFPEENNNALYPSCHTKI